MLYWADMIFSCSMRQVRISSRLGVSMPIMISSSSVGSKRPGLSSLKRSRRARYVFNTRISQSICVGTVTRTLQMSSPSQKRSRWARKQARRSWLRRLYFSWMPFVTSLNAFSLAGHSKFSFSASYLSSSISRLAPSSISWFDTTSWLTMPS